MSADVTSKTTSRKPNPGNRTDRRGHGPGPYEPTEAIRKQVEALASYGVPQEQIAKVAGICIHTLTKYYGDTLATAAIKANSLVAQTLFNRAVKGDGPSSTTACIFWLKARAGWREKEVHEITGPEGGPIQSAVSIMVQPIPSGMFFDANGTLVLDAETA